MILACTILNLCLTVLILLAVIYAGKDYVKVLKENIELTRELNVYTGKTRDIPTHMPRDFH